MGKQHGNLRDTQLYLTPRTWAFDKHRLSKTSACWPSANIAFRFETAELIPEAREPDARPSTAKEMVVAPSISARFAMGGRRLVFGGLCHPRMGELHSRSQRFANYAVGSGPRTRFLPDDPWWTLERVSPLSGNGCLRSPGPAKRCGLADRRWRGRHHGDELRIGGRPGATTVSDRYRSGPSSRCPRAARCRAGRSRA